MTVAVMLAASEIPEPQQIPFHAGMTFSLKYDGVRTYAEDRNAFSRKCELWPNVFVQDWFYKHHYALDGMDGELIVGPPNAKDVFQRTMSGITSQDGQPDFKFYVFDLYNLDSPASFRYKTLQKRLSILPLKVRQRLVLVKQHPVSQYEPLHQMYLDAIETGYEGLIGRRIDGLYKNGRSTLKEALLLKFKEFQDSEIQITGIQQGKSNQNEKEQDKLGKAKRSTAKSGKVEVETIGSFLGIDVNPASPFYGKPVKVGPGDYKKDVLAQMWADYQKDASTLVGKFLTYKYQVSGVKDAPRYPGSRSAKGIRSKCDF